MFFHGRFGAGLMVLGSAGLHPKEFGNAASRLCARFGQVHRSFSQQTSRANCGARPT